MSVKSIAPQIVSCHVMQHGRPQFLFSSGIQCSACFALLESSMHCTWPTQRSSSLYCGIQHILSCCFPCSFIGYTFNILLRQNAVILFNCRSVTITWCNSTATCAPMFSLTAGIHALLVYTNLQAKFLKIRGLKSLNAAAASHIVTSRQSVMQLFQVDIQSPVSRLPVAGQSTSSRQSVIFSTVSHISLRNWLRGLPGATPRHINFRLLGWYLRTLWAPGTIFENSEMCHISGTTHCSCSGGSLQPAAHSVNVQTELTWQEAPSVVHCFVCPSTSHVMNWSRKLVPEVRRGVVKRVITDFQMRGDGWTSECDNSFQQFEDRWNCTERLRHWWWELCK